MSKKMLVGKAIKFNPSESIINGSIAKKIPMGALTEFQRKINGFEYSEYNNGPKFRNGDTVVAKITPCLENGKTAFVDILDDNEIAFGSSEFIVLRKTEYTDSEFIYYFARSPLFRERAINCMEGTSGRKRVNENTLKNLEFVFPDLPTQKSIAKVLSDLDAKIELNNRINRELEAMAKTLYDYWFVQFDFPDANGKPYKSSGGKMVYNAELKREIPEGWEVKIINNFIEVKDGTHDSPKPKERGFHLITSKNLLESGLDFENANLISEEDYININKRSKVETGDILFSMIGSIGVVYKVEESNIRFAVKNVALYKTSQKQEYKNFIYQYLKSYDMQRYMGTVISGSIQKFIGLGSLRNMPLLFNKATLKTYISKTNPIYLKLNNIKKQNQQLSELRDWLLPMLMNGQITVKEVEERLSMAAEPRVEYKKG